ncbi:amidohydrolase family protein [Pararoseomonas indoligenes]|uniref:Amidohydrolase family protein n=1 Tax=Roseomonas indoligenes TaxID=2820811 RepID=A0A940N5J2_9PROT|nr:amidohydrolase family protein [Pararoseomonas indoligenes]MBP0495530.1 amidohydrolase family protein [Pararoseomonas indoligenes]
MRPPRRALLAGLSLAATSFPVAAQTVPAAPRVPEAFDPRRPLLIRGATVVTMDPAVPDLARGDILVRDGAIAAIGPVLDAPEGAQVLEAAGRIAIPGLVNAHIHLGQALQRGMSADQTLAQYFATVVAKLSSRLSPDDLRAADYGGSLELLDAGVTTVLDWSRETTSPGHADAALDAFEASGIRAVFAYGLAGSGAGSVRSANSPEAVAEDMRRLRAGRMASPGRVRLALAIRGPDFSTMDEVAGDIRLAREFDLLVQFHAGAPVYAGRTWRGIAMMRERGLLTPKVSLAHANDLDEDEYRMVADAGGSTVSTPEVEMQMGHGFPCAARMQRAGGIAAVGSDISAGVGGDVLVQARIALAAARGLANAEARQAGTLLPQVAFTTRQALHWATLGGARAAGLGDVAGSLTPGKRADIVLLRADTVGASPVHDPVAAVLNQGGAAAVETVMVDGRVLKRDGRLLHADAARAAEEVRRRAAALEARSAT